MRISNNTLNRYANQDLMKYQIEIAQLQAQISSGKKLEKPSDDPVNAAREVSLSNSLSQIEQYNRNIIFAQARLSNEESHIADSENLLLRIRELALVSNNSATSAEVYPSITAELEQLLADLVSHANATDPEGNFIFSGNMTSTKPFSPGSSEVYHGDDQQRLVQVNQSIQMATADSGKDIFLRIPASDQSHTAKSNPVNTGDASIVLSSDGAGASAVSDSYTLQFPTPDTYNIVNRDTGITEVSGATVPTSKTITHAGLQISLTGTAADNDEFFLDPTGQQDIFTTVGGFIELLNNPPQNSADKAINRQKLNEILINVDQAFEHMTSKRANIGSRLSSLDTIKEENEATKYQLTVTLSGIEDLDYTNAISNLQLKATALEALQKTITRTQSLTLFNS